MTLSLVPSPARVLKVAFPFQDVFDYAELAGVSVRIGQAVEVPLGARRLVGYVVGFADASAHKLRPILRVLDEIPPLPEDLLKLAAFVSDYYIAPAGEVLRMLIPPPARRRVLEHMQISEAGKDLIKRDPEHHLKLVSRVRTPAAIAKKLKLSLTDTRTLIAAWQTEGLVTLGEKLSAGAKAETHPHLHRKSEFTPTSEQDAALSQLFAAQDLNTYHGFLLHGVTGSGKTEVYLACIERALMRGKTALVLVPEIGLTPQVQARFEERFGGEVVTIHSALTPVQRRQAWYRVQIGDARVVVGPRSALFAPLAELGVIIVDEEHDESYKQDEAPRYHARDLALVRAKHASALCVLGSATPSLETLHNVFRGKLTLLTLRQRATGASLPIVEIVTMATPEKTSVKSGREIPLFSRTLTERIQETVERGEQVILFLNRRGFAPFVLCQSCGEGFRCPNCSVSLTHHLKRSLLMCHYCGHTEGPPRECPHCHSTHLRTQGSGTERLELELKRAFPAVAIARLDRDVAQRPADLHQALHEFRTGKTQILVGTQMVTKGHDFPNVTLVGVVFADAGLNFPDFRAAERTAQQLVQVAGRSGRAEKPGRVLVQTYHPTHAAILAAETHDYLSFARGELEERQALGYPPFSRMLLLRCDGEDLTLVRERLSAVADRLRAQPVEVLGPAPCPLERLHGRFRMMLLLRHTDAHALRAAIRAAGVVTGDDGKTKLVLDCDPVTML